MVKGTLICFIGMDGVGKTLHALTLVADLRKRGIACKYVWCRWFPGFADPFDFLVRKILRYTARKYKFLKPLQTVYLYLVVLDYLIPLFFKVKIPSLLGRCVIIDRYVYDRLADLCFIGLDVTSHNFFVRLFIGMNPKPGITFLLDAPIQVILTRKNELSSIEIMRYKRVYRDIARIYSFKRIVNIDFNKAHNRILTEVLERIS